MCMLPNTECTPKDTDCSCGCHAIIPKEKIEVPLEDSNTYQVITTDVDTSSKMAHYLRRPSAIKEINKQEMLTSILDVFETNHFTFPMDQVAKIKHQAT